MQYLREGMGGIKEEKLDLYGCRSIKLTPGNVYRSFNAPMARSASSNVEYLTKQQSAENKRFTGSVIEILELTVASLSQVPAISQSQGRKCERYVIWVIPSRWPFRLDLIKTTSVTFPCSPKGNRI